MIITHAQGGRHVERMPASSQCELSGKKFRTEPLAYRGMCA
jgi:hypothetical protein